MMVHSLATPSLPAFLATSALVILVPGPATLFVIGQAGQSARAAATATLGILLGDVVLILLSGFGFATLLSHWPGLLDGVQIAGALYVGYLGVALLRSDPAAPSTIAWRARPSATGFLITITNPKPILFFAAFFPLFIPSGAGSYAGSYAALGLWFETLNILYFTTLIMLTRQLKSRFAPAGRSRLPYRLAGLGLLVCALVILASALHSFVTSQPG